ncbi:MAG: hypothetical protein IID61_09315 [SAR324 cluster bacterium]|nr:hypothetical protein [SAR324 cluster bacterium]
MNRRRRGSFVVLGALILAGLGLPATVSGQTEKPVAALARVAVLGDISEVQQRILATRVESFLSDRFELISQEEYQAAEDAAFASLDLDQCTEETCIRVIQDFLQVERLFFLQVLREGSFTVLSITLYTGDTRRTVDDTCDNCSISQLYSKVEILALRLIGEEAPVAAAPEPPPAQGTLSLTGWTPDHRLSVDGRSRKPDRRGRLQLEPGTYSVLLSRKGYQSRTAKARIEGDKTTPLSARLEPVPPAPELTESGASGGLLATGIVFLAAGGVLLQSAFSAGDDAEKLAGDARDDGDRDTYKKAQAKKTEAEEAYQSAAIAALIGVALIIGYASADDGAGTALRGPDSSLLAADFPVSLDISSARVQIGWTLRW